MTPEERLILAVDRAALVRIQERLTRWAEVNVEKGRRARLAGNEAARARYGAAAAALFAAARRVPR